MTILLYDFKKNPLRVGETLIIRSGIGVVKRRQTARPLMPLTVNVANPINTAPVIFSPPKIVISITDNLLECPICFKKFSPKWSDQVYCSGRCRVAHHRGRQLEMEGVK